MQTATYDILEKSPDGTHVWVEAVRDFEAAKHRMIELATRMRGDYFVLNQQTGQIVSSIRATLGGAQWRAHDLSGRAAER